MAPLGKDRIQRQIDTPPALSAGNGEVIASTANSAPPVQAIAPVPTGLLLDTGVSQSDRSATSWVEATWAAPYGTQPSQYTVQIATNTAFTQNLAAYTITAPTNGETPRYRFTGLKPGVVYYVRVACHFYEPGPYCDAVAITSAQDTTPPSAASSVTATLQNNGDLVVTGMNPSEQNFARIIITIRGSGVGPTYDVIDVPGQPGQAFRAVWTAADNVRQSGGGDGTLTLTVEARSWAGFSSSPQTLTATKNAPTTPTGVAVDFTSPDALFRCNTVADAAVYEWTIDGVIYPTTDARFTYLLAQNRQQHGTPQPSLIYSVRVRDALNQYSAATANATAINPIPPNVSTPTVDTYFSSVVVTWTATEPPDFDYYRVRVLLDDIEIGIERPATQNLIYAMAQSGEYRFAVRMVDVFGQVSAAESLSAVARPQLTVAELRADMAYSDSLGTAPSVLAALKDTNTTSGGVTYT